VGGKKLSKTVDSMYPKKTPGSYLAIPRLPVTETTTLPVAVEKGCCSRIGCPERIVAVIAMPKKYDIEVVA